MIPDDNILNLPSVSQIRPRLVSSRLKKYTSYFIITLTYVVCVGATPPDSKENLVHWIDDLVLTEAHGEHCFVDVTDGTRQPGTPPVTAF